MESSNSIGSSPFHGINLQVEDIDSNAGVSPLAIPPSHNSLSECSAKNLSISLSSDSSENDDDSSGDEAEGPGIAIERTQSLNSNNQSSNFLSSESHSNKKNRRLSVMVPRNVPQFPQISTQIVKNKTKQNMDEDSISLSSGTPVSHRKGDKSLHLQSTFKSRARSSIYQQSQYTNAGGRKRKKKIIGLGKIGWRPEDYQAKSKNSGANPREGFLTSFTNNKKNPKLLRRLSKKVQQIIKLEDEDDYQKWNQRIVISTASAYFQAWKIFLILLSFISSFDYAYRASFQDSTEEVGLNRFEIVYETFFIIDILVNFVTEHHYAASNKVERDFRVIFCIYAKGRFLFDLVATFPLDRMLRDIVSGKHLRLVYLVKLVRLYAGFQLLNHKSYMKQVKSLFNQRMQRIIQQDSALAQSQDIDNNYISHIVAISFFLKTNQLIVIILCGSYFTGAFWFIFCDLTKGIDKNDDHFLEVFKFDARENFDKMVMLTYFSFTTLSTVGLGDFHPRSNMERLMGSFILLFGVSITTYIIDLLKTMVNQGNWIFKSFEESTLLGQFFGTLEKFNSNHRIDQKVQTQFEHYFQYRWGHDKNQAMTLPADQDLFLQLPKTVQIQIYSNFLYKDFLRKYRRFFKFRPTVRIEQVKQTPVRPSAPPASDKEIDAFLEFQMQFLKLLEPKFFNSFNVVLGQEETADEITFIMNSEVRIGYNSEAFLLEQGLSESKAGQLASSRRVSVKKKFGRFEMMTQFFKLKWYEEDYIDIKQKHQFPLALKAGQPIGAFEVMFNKPSMYLYKTYRLKRPIDCFFIRRRSWHSLLQESENLELITGNFKKYFLLDFVNQIYFPLTKYQDKLKQSHEQLITEQRKIKEQMAMSIRAKAQPTFRQQKSIVVQKTNLLNDSELPLNEEEGSPSAKAALRSKRMFSESPFGDVNNNSFVLQQSNNHLSGDMNINQSGVMNESEVQKNTMNSGIISVPQAPMTKSPASTLAKQHSLLSRISATSKVSKFSKIVEAKMAQREHGLARAITFRENIKDKDLKFIVDANLRHEADDSNSNVSSFLAESKLGKFEVTLEVLYRVLNQKFNRLKNVVHDLTQKQKTLIQANEALRERNQYLEAMTMASSLAQQQQEYSDFPKPVEPKQTGEFDGSLWSKADRFSPTERSPQQAVELSDIHISETESNQQSHKSNIEPAVSKPTPNIKFSFNSISYLASPEQKVRSAFGHTNLSLRECEDEDDDSIFEERKEASNLHKEMVQSLKLNFDKEEEELKEQDIKVDLASLSDSVPSPESIQNQVSFSRDEIQRLAAQQQPRPIDNQFTLKVAESQIIDSNGSIGSVEVSPNAISSPGFQTGIPQDGDQFGSLAKVPFKPELPPLQQKETKRQKFSKQAVSSMDPPSRQIAEPPRIETLQTVRSGGAFEQADKGGTNLKLESDLSDQEPIFSAVIRSIKEESKTPSRVSKISEDIPEEIAIPNSDSKQTDSRYLSNYGYNEFDRITTDNEIMQQATIPILGQQLSQFQTPPNLPDEVPSEVPSQKSIHESIRIPPSQISNEMLNKVGLIGSAINSETIEEDLPLDAEGSKSASFMLNQLQEIAEEIPSQGRRVSQPWPISQKFKDE